MHQDRPLEPRLRLELGEQAVHVVDVPGALDLRDHDHVELVADLGDERGDVVEHPRALERVDPRPQRGVAEVDLLGDLDQPLARGDLVVDRDRVLEVAEQDVGLLGHVGHLGRHLLVRGVEEVDHPRRLERDLEHRLGRADRERVSEVAGVSHLGSSSDRSWRGRNGNAPGCHAAPQRPSCSWPSSRRAASEARLPRMAFEVRAAQAGEEERSCPCTSGCSHRRAPRPGAWDERRAAVALRDAIDSHDACVLVADDGGELVGICTAYQDIHSVRFGYRGWVEDLAVDPERRSQGGRPGAARRGQGLGPRARRDPPRARLGGGARRRAPLLRARGRRLQGDLVRLGALSGWRGSCSSAPAATRGG